MEGRKERKELASSETRGSGSEQATTQNKGESRGRWRVYRRTVHVFATISSHEIDSGPADADEASIVDSTKSSSIARLAERSRIYRVPRSDWRRSQTGPKGRTGESSRAERRRNREILTHAHARGRLRGGRH